MNSPALGWTWIKDPCISLSGTDVVGARYCTSDARIQRRPSLRIGGLGRFKEYLSVCGYF